MTCLHVTLSIPRLGLQALPVFGEGGEGGRRWGKSRRRGSLAEDVLFRGSGVPRPLLVLPRREAEWLYKFSLNEKPATWIPTKTVSLLGLKLEGAGQAGLRGSEAGWPLPGGRAGGAGALQLSGPSWAGHAAPLTLPTSHLCKAGNSSVGPMRVAQGGTPASFCISLQVTPGPLESIRIPDANKRIRFQQQSLDLAGFLGGSTSVTTEGGHRSSS